MHEYRKYWESKSYNTENSCTEIMQHFGFSFRILHSKNWSFWISFATYLHPWKTNTGKQHDMFVSWQNEFDWNTHLIMQKYVRYLVKKSTHNNSLVFSSFLWRDFLLSTLTYWNHQPDLCHNLVLVYLIKLIRILALMQHILVSFINFFLQNKW